MIRILLAIFFPPLVFFTIGRPIQGLLCLIYFTLIFVLSFILAIFGIVIFPIFGWIPCMVWAFICLSNYKNERRIREFEFNQSRQI
ncbi:hypothetical protein [Taylorella equigenitalis]|uniref:Membrane protein n=3 Tax=Taylorella equigenitalis TaxID=29575 RepID=A0A654KHD4_TAYEM|nr:hypothetical protein [Taylorella equigenitalis]ADU91812.1 Putative membrane protein [Taylorella equigenitalis MCE9]AFN35377.1 hypothetical protein KUI_0276 [Taylorella equigenitalis ATCC 35865]ASY30037.1 hypothetical protein B9Z30_01255 [Taylorella equigenitalis]ASY37342.1 hypothetical protein CA605_01210 [Taylorella equigenitalis]ASY38808.1 hypothetical protein CA604_01365 [Taylorella equigenitalis]